ncbi:hypothetical protein JVT61DRAFT_6071 [Boletus reticuloceps]|uniref:Uncharacterized protein n=1 Tax=Boletus reticuloceps TaxID=495285 RepID=A0A8I2YLE9_9AGAM|nr:hypothetical protein JVT61DRAFT_6071 [Boletus reticuloceps]
MHCRMSAKPSYDPQASPLQVENVGDLPRSIRLDDGHIADSVDRHSSTSSTITLQPLGQVVPLVSKTASTSISDFDANSVHSDAMVKDPEALLAKNFDVYDASRTDPSVLATGLITALGLLTSHSSNPKVIILQLSAAVVSFTLIALHSFHSKTLANMVSISSCSRDVVDSILQEQHPAKRPFVQRLLKYFPLLVFASCWILFLLSVTFTSPKVMTIAVLLVVFASIPIVCGARLPAALTVGIITLFGLTFFGLVFLVCILPIKLLV